MDTPKLTHAFTVVAYVTVPTGMGPGNELCSLTVVDGSSETLPVHDVDCMRLPNVQVTAATLKLPMA